MKKTTMDDDVGLVEASFSDLLHHRIKSLFNGKLPENIVRPMKKEARSASENHVVASALE